MGSTLSGARVPGGITMTPFILAPMGEEELPQVVAIERAVFPSPWTMRLLRAALTAPSTTAWIVRAGQQVVGYLLFSLVIDECDLLNIAVAPAFRRQGIARLLMQRMVDDVGRRGATAVWLDVRVSNAAAQSLYRAFGFQVVDRRKRYYQQEGEDALVMRLDLRAMHGA